MFDCLLPNTSEPPARDVARPFQGSALRGPLPAVLLDLSGIDVPPRSLINGVVRDFRGGRPRSRAHCLDELRDIRGGRSRAHCFDELTFEKCAATATRGLTACVKRSRWLLADIPLAAPEPAFFEVAK